MDKNEKTQITPYFPAFINLSKKEILIIGGGVIATRRVKTLLPFDPDILLVSPGITGELQELVMQGRLKYWKKEFTIEDLSVNEFKNADIVCVVTNHKELNAAIGKRCRELAIPVNVADNKELCDFYFPGVVLKDHVTIGITANGLDHVKAKKVREQIEKIL